MSFISSYIHIKDKEVWKDNTLIYRNTEGISNNKFYKLLYKQLAIKYMKFYKMDTLSKLGLLASEYLLGDRTLTSEFKAEDIGIILMNRQASLITDIKYYDTIKDTNNYFPSPSLFVYTLANIVMGEIAIKNNFKGENIFYVQEHFNAGLIHNHTEQLLQRGSQQALLCGWLEVEEDKIDGFLYLVENNPTGLKLEHSIENINRLKNQYY